MHTYRTRPRTVQAVQFRYDGDIVPGVFYPSKSETGRYYIGDAFVVRPDGQRIPLENGDWIIAEPDGEHYSVMKADVFEAEYESVEGIWA